MCYSFQFLILIWSPHPQIQADINNMQAYLSHHATLSHHRACCQGHPWQTLYSHRSGTLGVFRLPFLFLFYPFLSMSPPPPPPHVSSLLALPLYFMLLPLCFNWFWFDARNINIKYWYSDQKEQSNPAILIIQWSVSLDQCQIRRYL